MTRVPTAAPTGDRDRPPARRPAGEPPTYEVVAELAHDVRSPLFVAREVVRVLREAVDDRELLHLADRAMAAVDRVDATLESAIDHARLGQAPSRRHIAQRMISTIPCASSKAPEIGITALNG